MRQPLMLKKFFVESDTISSVLGTVYNDTQ